MRDIDDILTQALQPGRSSVDFKTRLKQQSSLALVQGYAKRRRFRRTLTIAAALVLTFTAYLTGHYTAHSKLESPQQTVQTDNTVQVPKDLVTWLEAAQFFNQLGMEQRAANAYRQASLLTNQDLVDSPYAHESIPTKHYASLLARCDQTIKRQNKQSVIKNSDNPYAMLAQSFGGQNHEN